MIKIKFLYTGIKIKAKDISNQIIEINKTESVIKMILLGFQRE